MTTTSFRDSLQVPGSFSIAVELVTARGLVTNERSRALVEKARALAADPRIDVLSITDNPGGNAMLAPDTLGTDLVSRGQEVIIHLACKDWNRNALESRGWKLASEGFDNVLCLSGDYPVTGYGGTAAPVFDIDSVGLLKLFSDMDAGLRVARTGERLERTNFFLGCVVTNHKLHEREVVPQYQKLAKKARTGARFVINQIGYNARKDDELLRYIRRAGLEVRALANVYLLSLPAARAFHAGRIPGVIVTDELLALAERQAASPDKGRSFFMDLAAKQLTVARGLGFGGAYLGGHTTADTFFEILDRAKGYGGADWRELSRELRFGRAAEFYLFEPDPDTGLSSDELNPAYVKSKEKRRTDLRVPLSYRFSRRVHQTVFEPEGSLHDAARSLYEKVDAAPRPVGRAAHLVEQAAKVPMFK
ncbi:MAG TPA: methylenetetrahydrofolate reductase, partial [Solirubrobacteraceae bacterium]|nr:methylenetetrahydrofolate reductase [Solirubrobacteraceae bacterium]